MENVHGPCRLPYQLCENDGKTIDSGYLLSPRDLCALDFIPQLIKAGVCCFKIEGRMKTPEYVATVTRIYRKYIDLIKNNQEYVIEKKDQIDLMQVFNRGNFSSGHLSTDANTNLIFKEKPNNMGLYLGKVESYQSKKGLITLTLKEPISIGDTISLEKEDGTYTISELMENMKNIKSGVLNQTVTIGRMKGNISIGDSIYKIGDKQLLKTAKESYEKESKKTDLDIKLWIKKEEPISVEITSQYFAITEKFTSNIIPDTASSLPLSKEKIIAQLEKTKDTPFIFKSFSIELDDHLFLPISSINSIRRMSLEKIEEKIIESFRRSPVDVLQENSNSEKDEIIENKEISLLLNTLNLKEDYSKLNKVDNLYIPLTYFYNSEYIDIIHKLEEKAKLFIYLPVIMRKNEINIFVSQFENILNNYNISGVIISSLSQLEILKPYKEKYSLGIIGNYNLNIYNRLSIEELKQFGIQCFTISPELDKQSIKELTLSSILPSELIVYGRIALMNSNYCLIGNTNKCKKVCNTKCSNNKYYLKDRMNFNFPLLSNNGFTTIYNSKITSIDYTEFNSNSIRIDILDENINDINSKLEILQSGKRLEGKDYTNSNLNRDI